MDNQTIEIKVVVSGVSTAQSQLRSFGSSTKGLTGSFFKANIAAMALDKGIRFLADVFRTGARAASDFIQSSVMMAANLQGVKVSLEKMLPAGTDVTGLLEELSDFAAKTPFNLTGLQEYSKQLVAAGYDSDELIPTLEALGDVAAGVGTDKLPFLIKAFGDARVKGKFMGEEIRQLRNAGIAVDKVFKEKLGMTIEEVNDSIKNGTLSFKDAENALLSLGREGGKFNDLMAAQAKTLPGVISNLEDTRDSFMRMVGGIDEGGNIIEGGLLDVVSKAAFAFQQFTSENEGPIKEFGSKLSTFLGGVFTKIGEIITFLFEHKDQIAEVVSKVTDFAKGFGKGAFSAFMDTLKVTGAIIKDIILPALDDLRGAIGDAMGEDVGTGNFAETLGQIWGFVQSSVIPIIAMAIAIIIKFVTVILKVGKTVTTVIGTVIDFFKNFKENMKTIWEFVKETIRAAIEKIIGFFTTLVTEKIPYFIGRILGFFLKLPGRIPGYIETLKNKLRILFENIKTIVIEKFNTMKTRAIEKAKSLRDSVVNFIKTLPQRIKNLVPQFIQAGRDVVNGIKDGISGGFGNIGGTLVDKGKQMFSNFMRGIDARSPSKLFMKAGAAITDGINLGMGNIDDPNSPLMKTTSVLNNTSGGGTGNNALNDIKQLLQQLVAQGNKSISMGDVTIGGQRSQMQGENQFINLLLQ